MSRRDYVAEILEKRGRQAATWQRWDALLQRLAAVASMPNHLSRLSLLADTRVLEELSRHIPIGLVACMEGYFRMAFANLIDYGSPFRENAGRLPNVTFSLDTALAIQRESVSIGEFVSHLLPLSSLDDLNKTLSILLGEDYLVEWKRTRLAQPRQLTLFPELDLDTDARVLNAVTESFRLRHIFCHELAPEVTLDMSQASEITDHVIEFLWVNELIIRKRLVQDSNLRRPRGRRR